MTPGREPRAPVGLDPRRRAAPAVLRLVLSAARRALLATALAATLVLALASASRPIALAADPSPTPAPAGDTRSSGEGPGFVGRPLFAIGGVAVVALVAVGATLVYVRLTARRD